MTFKCRGCGEEVSNSKMAGLALGKISKTVLESKKISSTRELATAFSSGELAAGYLSGLGVACPKCRKSNWD